MPRATSLMMAGLPTDKSALLAAVLGRLADLADRWDGGSDLRADVPRSANTMFYRLMRPKPE